MEGWLIVYIGAQLPVVGLVDWTCTERQGDET